MIVFIFIVYLYIISLSSKCCCMACYLMLVFLQQLQNHDVIFTLLKPWCRTVQSLLWSFVPVPSEEMAIDPEISFLKQASIKEGISMFLYSKGTFPHDWNLDIRFLFIPEFHGIIDRNRKNIPIILTFQDGMIIIGLELVEVD